jgi:polyisoprenoid-binding protein YceI
MAYAADGPGAFETQSGTASFEAGTNVPGIEVKGASGSLSAHAAVSRDPGGLVIDQITASLPIKTLSTGMKVRDEHMRKYIFTTSAGQTPDLEFTGETACRSAGADFDCDVSGVLTIRGASRPFRIKLNLKEVSGGAYRAAGDGVVKLSDYGIAQPSQFGVSTTNEVKLHLGMTAYPKPNALAGIGGAR